MVVTSCRSSRTASTLTSAPAIRAAFTATATTAAPPDAVKNNRGCPSCSAQSLWGEAYEATSDYGCRCDGNYQTTVGPSGDLICHDDDCAEHDECGDGGTCVDLSVAESGPAGKFTCTCHAVMRSLSMEVLMVVTPVRVSVVDNSDKHPSVAFVSGDSVTVNCNEGYSVDRRHLGVTP